jgi:adhesin/invasin
MRSTRRLLVPAAIIVGFACTDDRQIGPPAIASIVIAPDTATVLVGDSLFLQLVARDANGHGFIGVPATWSSRASAVATVSQTGLVKGVSTGGDTITATSGGFTATAVVAVVPRPLIAFSRDSMGFTAFTNGPNPPPDSVFISNAGGGSLGTLGLAGITYGTGASGWLGATLSGAPESDTLTLAAQTGTLAAGVYSATVSVTAANATNSPRSLKVSFTVGAGASQSSVAAAPTSITACGTGCAAGTTASTVTVTVRDALGNVINGATVTPSATGSSNTFTPASGTTGANGVFTTTFSSTKAEVKTISAVANGTAITQTAAVTVNAATPVSMAEVPGTNLQAARVGPPVATLPAVLVSDQFGNPVPGVSITFGSVTGGGVIGGSPASTGVDGIARPGSWQLGTTAGDSAHGTYLNGVTASPASGTLAGSPIVFQDSGFYSLASDVMPIFAAAAAGPCSGCHSPGFHPDFTSATTFFNATVNVTGRCNATLTIVVPKDASNSLLQLFLNGSGTSCTPFGVMPPAGALPANQRRIVSDWINRNALNN